MTQKEKVFHNIIIAIFFSIVNWLIVDNLIIPISFWKYLIIELMFVLSQKLFKFTVLKLKLEYK